jgi:hypothetical protein
VKGKATASATPAAHAATEKHLKDILGVHASHSTALLDFFNVFSAIISLFLLRV